VVVTAAGVAARAVATVVVATATKSV